MLITEIERGSPAQKAGIRAGETLLSINGHDINDLLDYRFYMTDETLDMRLRDRQGADRGLTLRKGEYDDLGLGFESYLMDEQRRCRNSCVFCFIDQMPPGMRESLYFKDDDDRLSFLTGNYITLTNLDRSEIERIIKLRISPMNISVHTANKSLRCKMMGNRFAGESLEFIPMLARGGISMNAQLVLCPGINDGDELKYSLEWLSQFWPQMQSVACVPVGLTRFRQGLSPLEGYTRHIAAQTLDIIEGFADNFYEGHGTRLAYASDEFYLTACRALPPLPYYEELAQLENGVGMMALFEDEFLRALKRAPKAGGRKVSAATGCAAHGFISGLVLRARERLPALQCDVYAIRNEYFGESITVSGLITGGDLIKQLRGKRLGEALLIPANMLRHDGEVFLDDISPRQLSNELNVPMEVVDIDGAAFLDALV